jgi:hypothetical protein
MRGAFLKPLMMVTAALGAKRELIAGVPQRLGSNFRVDVRQQQEGGRRLPQVMQAPFGLPLVRAIRAKSYLAIQYWWGVRGRDCLALAEGLRREAVGDGRLATAAPGDKREGPRESSREEAVQGARETKALLGDQQSRPATDSEPLGTVATGSGRPSRK